MSSKFTDLESQENNNDKNLNDLRIQLEPFDVASLLATAGALELLPTNAERMLRIQAFAHVVCSLPYRPGRPSISAPRLRQALNGPELGAFAHREDPFPNVFVEEVPFYEGSFLVFPGSTSDSGFVFRLLSRAVFKHHAISERIAQRIYQLISGCLKLSNTIALRAGFKRGSAPSTPETNAINIPSARQLNSLKEAVTFTREEIESCFGPGEIGDSPWEKLTISPGSLSCEDFSFEDSRLTMSPIVQLGNTFIVACPEALLTALNHHIITLAAEGREKDALADAYADAVMLTTIRAMRYLDVRPVNKSLAVPGVIGGTRECLFRCDSDKLIYVLIVTDQLQDFQANLPSGGPWKTPDLEQQVENRIRQIEDYLYGQDSSLNELLCLLIHGGVGRVHSMKFAEFTRAAEFQIFPAEDFETFSLIEQGNSLALWRFAKESNKLRNRAHVISFSALDEFGFYRHHKHSFYASDEKPPNLLSFLTDFSATLRREVHDKRDWHAVPHYNRKDLIEVTTLHGDSKIPIYVPATVWGHRIAVLVEGLPFLVWVLVKKEDHDNELHSFYAEFAAAIGYWLWQCSTQLQPILATIDVPNKPVLVNVVLPEAKDWWVATTEMDKPNVKDLIVFSANLTDLEVTLELKKGALVFFNTADNYAERESLRQILLGLAKLFKASERLSEDAIATIIDVAAPLGVKKMMFLLDTGRTPELDPRDIPRFRPSQDGDIDDVLDRIGLYLRESLNMSVGPIAEYERNNVLKQTVKFCYEQLKALIRAHSSEGFLEFLIERNESIVREDVYRRLTISTRIACFSEVGDIVKQLHEELPEIAQTALATRFLVEFSAAQPPTGVRRISLSSYDEMQALAVQVITFGMLSDGVKYGLDDVQLSILKSGRLGRLNSQYHVAATSYLQQHTNEDISESASYLNRLWPFPKMGDAKPNSLVQDLDAAASEEFGFTMKELSEFLQVVQEIGNKLSPSVAAMDIVELVKQIASTLQWPEPRVHEAINFFSLVPRPDFLVAPDGMKATEVYPWRFNRALSYLRRPLVQRQKADGTVVLWGGRHVERSRENLFNLCLSGRLKAASDGMREFISKFRNKEGEQFNDLVADTIIKHGIKCERRIKRIGKFQFDNLGDIDVLGVDNKKRRILVIECKDLSIARTPHELATEIERILHGHGAQRSIVAKHQDRVRWIEGHIPDVIQFFKEDLRIKWRVESYIVVDKALMTPHLRQCPVTILTIEQIKQGLR